MVTAIYPTTFEPITKDHIYIAIRATKLFEKVIVAVADNTSKSTLFSLEERLALAGDVLRAHDNIDVKPFDDLVTNFAHQHDARVILRGIRAVSDFDYEFQMAGMNRQLLQEIETVFLTPAESLSFISSSLVREIASYNGDVSQFVEEPIASALKQKFS